MFDRRCDACGREEIDVLEPVEFERPTCGVLLVHHDRTRAPKYSECKGKMQRAWLTKVAAVIPDDIPGGVLIHNTICHPDGTPKRYYSKSEMKRAAAAKGYHNHVEHVPSPGSDKNRQNHTTRWI